MSSSTSFSNFAIFAAICGAAHVVHAVSQLTNWASTKKRRPTEIDAKKKLVVISGCDRGFGYLLAQALLKETDYLVLALALTEEGVKAVESLNDAAAAENRLFALQCDVTSDKDVQRVGDYVCEIITTQRNNAVLFSIVNNAGIPASGDFLFFKDISPFQKVMDVNFFGQLRLTQTLLPTMLETSMELSTEPRIINLSSVCGVAASPANSTYNASKFAVEAWSDSMRIELEPFHIKVVKIRPGQINTQIQSDWVTTYLANFAKAPLRIQELYGGDAFAKGAKEILAGMGDSASPPSMVVDVLLKTLTAPHSKLKPAYFVGHDAQGLWRALEALPSPVADTIKRMFRMSYPATNATIKQ